MSSSKLDLLTDNKPISLSVKDFIIRKMAVKLRMSERVIEEVVNHQFKSANNALRNNKSIEISGFGKFFFNEKKAMKLMAKYESQKALFEKRSQDETYSEQKRRSYGLKLQSALDNIRDLKPKLYEQYSESDLRGMEEQFIPSQASEGVDKENEQGEDEDMQRMSPPLQASQDSQD